MTTTFVAPVTILFKRDDGDESRDFDGWSSLQSDIDDAANELECTDWAVDAWDCDYADPRTFSDLDTYGEYAEKVEEYGEAYALRYADIGDHNHRDEYVGCYADEVTFVREDFAQCNDIPGNLDRYIDWELVAQDWMANYSSYQGSDGLHIYRD